MQYLYISYLSWLADSKFSLLLCTLQQVQHTWFSWDYDVCHKKLNNAVTSYSSIVLYLFMSTGTISIIELWDFTILFVISFETNIKISRELAPYCLPGMIAVLEIFPACLSLGFSWRNGMSTRRIDAAASQCTDAAGDLHGPWWKLIIPFWIPHSLWRWMTGCCP